MDKQVYQDTLGERQYIGIMQKKREGDIREPRFEKTRVRGGGFALLVIILTLAIKLERWITINKAKIR